ncbi:MAG TPA: hypothetical protein VGJ01_11380, partial [Pseudolabrys sp.]
MTSRVNICSPQLHEDVSTIDDCRRPRQLLDKLPQDISREMRRFGSPVPYNVELRPKFTRAG